MKRITDKIKHGEYAVYQGEEYRVTGIKEKWGLISENKDSLEKRFFRLQYNDVDLYKKFVDVSEIEAYYRIWGHVIYEGIEYGFEPGGKEDHILIITDNKQAAYHYGIETMLGIGEYAFYAPIKDVIVKEIKKKLKINGVQWWSDDEPVETYITYQL